ncbi:DNA gyrase subunit A [Anatilimnocola sp. NA78]|uniref:DNA gyrase subunit A n=1 Tax=Anatilimnocola sp. NA78 TaxID=3415683 RepID=UPI003CE55232
MPPINDKDRAQDQPIEDELKESYLVYAMSVIVSRALPDVRDGLKPSQRRILVAMNDLNLGPSAGRVKCAKISGDTSGNYHPHGESVIYPTLVRMAQDWNMRHVLIDKQGNFGSIAGLPPAAMRYTEARLSPIAALMLDDLDRDTVDFLPTYDERALEPTVLPSKFPNLLVNGTQGIAVGMATSIPPHNLREICDGMVRVIDEPDVSMDELLELIPGPDFPTGGMICGRAGIRRGYLTGRSTITVRARAKIEEHKKDRYRIVVTEIPYQAMRDNVMEKIASLVNEEKIKGISSVTDYSDLKQPVHIVIELKRDADPEVVLAQLYQFSPLQDSFSIILLALVDGKPRNLTLKQMLEEFLRHRVTVIRRRTQFLLMKARKRKHTVEGLLLALANIDEIIRIIRQSRTVAEAKTGLMNVEAPASMMERALGPEGFKFFQSERGVADGYRLTAVQADAILRMTLSQLVNLEQERLGGEHAELVAEMAEYQRILSDENNIRAIIREDLLEIRRKYGEDRRTELSGTEIGHVDLEDLITEETMVVSISHKGYIKRTPSSVYRAQKRGGKGLKGAETEGEDPIEHLFVASTHAYLMFFTTKGKVYWQKVYDLPELKRDSKGRAIVNLLNLAPEEKIAQCLAIRDYDLPEHYLVMGTRNGLVKKTPLAQYSRPKKTGIIAINLVEGDELVSVAIAKPGDELILSSAKGQAVRFKQSTVRSSGRNAQGVKGIKLRKEDYCVGMVVADPDATLLTVCEKGYGKRTPIGPNSSVPDVPESDVPEDGSVPEPVEAAAEAEDDSESSGSRYPTKGRGTMGVRDIKATERNGPVVAIAVVREDDELLMMTAGGKLQRIAAADVSVIGRNTQGVRIMSLDESDALIAVVRVPKEEVVAAEEQALETPALPPPVTPPPAPPEEDEAGN